MLKQLHGAHSVYFILFICLFIYLFIFLLACLFFFVYLFIYLFKFRLQRKKNCLLSQAMESCCNEFDALLGRLALTREDIDKVLSPLTSYAPQNSAHREIPKAISSCKSSEKKDKAVVKEREDYGDMEELD